MVSVLLFIIAFIFVLFLLFELSKNDFVLLRKNVSQHELFDKAFLSMLVGLFLGRVFYIVDIHNFSIFNPFRFFHLLKVPGLSLFGFLIGSLPLLYYLLRKKKVVSRIFDIFFISLFPLFIHTLITRNYSLIIPDIAIKIVLFIAGVGLLYVFIQFFKNYTLKDGSITLIILMLIALDIFVYGLTGTQKPLVAFLSLSQILSVIIFLTSIVLFFNNQNILRLKKK
jgi:hypothetical protein